MWGYAAARGTPVVPRPWAGKLLLLGLLLGLAGVWALVGPADAAGLRTRPLVSAGAVLLAALLYAGGSLHARHRMGGVPARTLALGQQLGAAAGLVVPAFVTGLACILPRLTMLYDRRSESPRTGVRASFPDSRTSTGEPSAPAETESFRRLVEFRPRRSS